MENFKSTLILNLILIAMLLDKLFFGEYELTRENISFFLLGIPYTAIFTWQFCRWWHKGRQKV